MTLRATASRLIVLARIGEAAVSVVKTWMSSSFLSYEIVPAARSDSEAMVFVVMPLLAEAHRVEPLMDRWERMLGRHPQLVLVVLTTQREEAEAIDGRSPTREALKADGRLDDWIDRGRAISLHYPTANRTYGEQVSWGLHRIREQCSEHDYAFLTNADSRVDEAGMRELLSVVTEGLDCAQQSALFLANFAQLGAIAATEALYQSRWTVETEVFRYLAGSGSVRWLPPWLARRWYQHAVGHGLLIAFRVLDRIGGLPAPVFGLEDAALGYSIRARGGAIHPLRTLELGDAPRSARALLRQRSTWVRGPLGALGYPAHSGRERLLVAQSVYDGLKWALTLPALSAEILVLRPRDRPLWALALLTRLYVPLAFVLRGLPKFDDYGIDELPRAKLRAAVALYPLAVISYGVGGLWGALRMLEQRLTGTDHLQPKTEA